MSILYANGWEAGSGTWYSESSAGWIIAPAGSGINSSSTYQHRTPNNIGGNYSWRPGWGMSCVPGTVTTAAQWLMFWAKPESGGVSRLNVQFGSGGTSQVNVRFMETGNIEIYRGSTILTTITGGYLASTSHWFAIKCIADSLLGEVQVWIDGVSVASYSGNTQNIGSSGWNQFGWGGNLSNNPAGIYSGGEWYIDDILVTDSSTGRLSEHFAPSIVPDGNSTPLDLTPSTGTNWQNVDEVPLSDSDYNEATAINEEDFYTISNLSTSPNSIACVNVLARVIAAGAITQGQCAVKSSSTAYQTAVVLPGGSYIGLNYVSETDPDTSLAWSYSTVNSMKIGIKFS